MKSSPLDPTLAISPSNRGCTARWFSTIRAKHGGPSHSFGVAVPSSRREVVRVPESRGARSYDVAVVGGGVAGLYTALSAAARGARVVTISKAPVVDSSSYLAQGGVAAAVTDGDSPTVHASDTACAGRGLCRLSAVEILTADAADCVAHLQELGVRFDADLGREGGHSRPRVLQVGGAATGAHLTSTLARRALEHPRIDVVDGERALELWSSSERCHGVLTDHGLVEAGATVLATGGAAALWERTTNPSGNIGEGMAAAFRAGAALADLEFVQFHPTALLGSRLLLTEALRGAGAVLIDGNGRRFTDELAPRDVVARAIDARGMASLDLRSIDRGHFAGLMATLERAGYHPATAPIPVAPAAHYTMGGIVTDLFGRSEVPGLYAVGETACTGVHGANRLASNSLLECLVFGRRAAVACLDDVSAGGSPPPFPTPAPDAPVSSELRRMLWRHAGLARDAAGLRRLLRAPVLLVRLMAQAALARTESRGAHFRCDFPTEDPTFAGHFVLRPGQAPGLEQWS